ncbi:RNase adapter RapZ [Rhodoferax sp. PAMC 29310]|uniref:RNase adapter RapZ n=1 Tax=Rhodoferax sp. PAMC 29310 TaxID=2822760 RepID=UPI001B31B793|nr:RNase adapter RapZ [Rhodoferax sp. PAMC 29310]
MPQIEQQLEIVLITGMSGSGKSVALNALEDAGYFCVDNLPPELLLSLIELEREQKTSRVAIAMDVRTATSLPILPEQLAALRKQGISVKLVFLDATTGTLVRRYSETRRKHPLSHMAQDPSSPDMRRVLVDAIELERELLSEIRENSHLIDTSFSRPAQLQRDIKSFVNSPAGQLTLIFKSFAFKHGAPGDADYLFDVRMLPNPHYEPELRHLTGIDAPVAEYLNAQPPVLQMLDHIQTFLNHWLDALANDHRSYVTVAIGCTGGQHRSVFLVERLVVLYEGKWATLKRHRELDALTGEPIKRL